MRRRYKELRPLIDSTKDYAGIEAAILKALKEAIYLPLIKELGVSAKRIENASRALADAILSGELHYEGQGFSGRLKAATSRELKRLGARWDKKQGRFLIPLNELPPDVLKAMRAAEEATKQAAAQLVKRLDAATPEKLGQIPKLPALFEAAIWKTEKNFQANVKGITVAPKLDQAQATRLAREWTDNAELYIRDFMAKETKELRDRIAQAAVKGVRYEQLVEEIQKSYGVTKRKATFLARQETSLLMAKFKQVRYEAAGVTKYKWTCVKMPHDKAPAEHVPGNVRYYHGILDGEIHEWNNPPIVDGKGNRKNPGQDYNCRCYPIPVVEFQTT